MHIAHRIVFAVLATVFAAIVLIAIIAYGGHFSRSVAVCAAFLAMVSQYTAQVADQDGSAKLFNLWADAFGLALALIAVLTFIAGF